MDAEKEQRVRFSRRLSVVVVLLGVVLIALSTLVDDSGGIILGGVTIPSGITFALFFRNVRTVFGHRVRFDRKTDVRLEYRPLGGDTRRVRAARLLIDDLRSVVRLFTTGFPSVTLIGGIGILVGVVLGGGVPVLQQAFDALEERMSDSRRTRMVGFSLTFGVFALLLVLQSAASTLYAVAYTVSRISVLVGGFSLSRM